MFTNSISYLKTCCCFPQQRKRPSGPIRRAEYHNARLRATLGLDPVPERSAPGQGNRPRSQSVRPRAESTTQEPRTPRTPRTPRAQTRFPVRPSLDMQFLKTNLDLEKHKELSNLVHKAFEHVPYALCGLSALIDHGFTARKADSMWILCPQDSRKNVLSWAAASGWEVYGDSIAVPTQEGIRRVKVKYVESGFQALQRVKSSNSNATVISLTSQLDNLAAGYLQYRREGNEGPLKIIESEIFWILKRMRALRNEKNEKIEHRFLLTFLSEACFSDFMQRHSHARAQMALAGINVMAAQAKYRAAASLREHNQLLKGHGMQGGVAGKQEGPSEKMNSGREEEKGESSVPSTQQPLEQSDARGGNSAGRDLTARKPPRQPKKKNRPPVEWV